MPRHSAALRAHRPSPTGWGDVVETRSRATVRTWAPVNATDKSPLRQRSPTVRGEGISRCSFKLEELFKRRRSTTSTGSSSTRVIPRNAGGASGIGVTRPRCSARRTSRMAMAALIEPTWSRAAATSSGRISATAFPNELDREETEQQLAHEKGAHLGDVDEVADGAPTVHGVK